MATKSILPVITVITTFSQLFVPSLGEDEAPAALGEAEAPMAEVCTVGGGCGYVDESREPIKYLMVGNPGTGKSTMLNGLARKSLFQSGLSFGAGKTTVLQKEQIGKDWYMDTPGLSDTLLRKEAAKAIEAAMKEGGAFKVVFVITIEAGRVRPADRTTMELILAAAPIAYYGVLINKLGKKEYNMLIENTDGAKDAVVAGLMNELPRKSLRFHFKQRDESLVDEEDAVPQLDEQFVRFMQHIPAVQIKTEEVKAIDVSEYDAMTSKFEGIITELYADKKRVEEKMKSDKEEYKKLLQEMQQRNDALMMNPEKHTKTPWAQIAGQVIVPFAPLIFSEMAKRLGVEQLATVGQAIPMIAGHLR
jgi:hypothetical protein